MRILVSDDVSEKGVAILREHFDVDVKTNMPPEELLACIGEYDGLVTRSQTQVTEEVIAAAHCGLPVVGIAMITNMAAGVLMQPLSGAEVNEIAMRRGADFRRLITALIGKI